MQYRNDKYGNPLSVLGYGCMRFTSAAGSVDIDKTEKEILQAIEGGVNYFDTAYIYPGSEAALGEILARNHLRDQVNIATKLPHYLIKSEASLDKFFEEELKRLKTDHVDYYLMHMLTDIKTWERLKSLGILEWIKAKQQSGQIRQIGFSYHGNSDMFCRLLDAYDWDFCQIQYNYLDENSQAGRAGLMHAAEKGIPVIIMEPLRGGRLTNHLPKEAEKLLREGGRTPAEWAFDWLWDQPQVTVVLSGMNSTEMVKENLQSAGRSFAGMLTEQDRALIGKAVAAINAKMKVGCTGCRYCMPCPMGVDIPGTFAAYNRFSTDGFFQGEKDFFMCTAIRKDSTSPSKCIGCGKCESHCPQHIQIREELKKARRTLDNPVYKVAAAVIKTVMKY
ncbi:MAG: aldo/keto reductase [Firmicutes bacterium]|nr:aldo/keto reductase [Bacillota bacterium]